MRFTAQEEYGLRCILNLARGGCHPPRQEPDAAHASAEGDPPSLTVSEIAGGEGLSEQYAGKLFRILAKSGLVESVRGRRGGYRMTRSPEEVSLGEALTALGAKIYTPEHCQRYTGHNDNCVHAENCPVRPVWMGLQKIVDHVLAGICLSDIVTEPRAIADRLHCQIEAIRKIGDSGGEEPVAQGSRSSNSTVNHAES